MDNSIIERYKTKRQMETEARILQLRIKRLEHQMAYELARAIGCRCCLISGGHQADDVLATAGEAQVIRSFEELYPMLHV